MSNLNFKENKMDTVVICLRRQSLVKLFVITLFLGIFGAMLFLPLPAAASNNGSPLTYGSTYHIKNNYSGAPNTYLDTRGAGCDSNWLCVSTASSNSRDQGSGSWTLLSAQGKSNGSAVTEGDLVYLANKYPYGSSGALVTGPFGGFLDARGGGCQNNALCVSTSANQNRDSGSGTWKIEGSGETIYSEQSLRLRNQYNGTYLDVRGGGCMSNILCVSTSTSLDRDSGSGSWRFEIANDQHALVQQLAPLVFLSAEENYYPSPVESHLENTEVRNGYYVTKQPLGCDSCTDPAFLRGSRPDAANIPVYAMVVQKDDGITTDFVYWMFYPYNNGKRVCIGAFLPYVGCVGGYSTFGNHVGDWEHVTIRLVNMVPTQITLSQHDSGETLNWGDPRVQMYGTHPVFYAATGSHGLYPDARRHTYKYLPNGDTLNDDTSAGVAWSTWNNIIEIRRAPLGQYSGNLSWLNFEGRWGNPKSGCEFSSMVSDECVLNDGPTGPMLKPASDPSHQIID
jgi:hypothetical protein